MEENKIKVVIITTPNASVERKENIENTLKYFARVLPPYYPEVQVDTWGSGTGAHIRALDVGLDFDALVILEDDSVVQECFASHLVHTPQLRNLGNSLVSFFTPRTRPQNWQKAIGKEIGNLPQKNALQFFELPQLVSGVGYMLTPKMARKMLAYAKATKLINENGEPHKNLTKNADFTIFRLYQTLTQGKVKYTYPSIVDHLNKGQESQVWLGEDHKTMDRSAWALCPEGVH